jgi:uncharacterized repeat protein (TIGR04138 family)
MNEMKFAEEILDQLQEQNPRYHERAFLFTLSALQSVMKGLVEPRHISGSELVHEVRRQAMHQFGPMARTVLGHWGIHETADVGEVVYALVECGILVTAEGDTREDFIGVFDFEEAFVRDYPWGASIT